MMRTIAWMFGFFCDLVVLALAAAICYHTYKASIVPSAPPIQQVENQQQWHPVGNF